MTENKPNQCSFCGNVKDVVKRLIVSDNAAICSECIDLCIKLVDDDSEVEQQTGSKIGRASCRERV